MTIIAISLTPDEIEQAIACSEKLKVRFGEVAREMFVWARENGFPDRVQMASVVCEGLLLAAHMAQEQTRESFVAQAGTSFDEVRRSILS